jgi:hypothetical protein
MSKPEIKLLTDFALFLPFSRIERRQTGTRWYKGEDPEVIERMKKTERYR